MAEYGIIERMRQSVQYAQDNVIRIAGEAMLEHKEQIIALLINQQQEQNEDSAGRPLRAYNPSYRNYKQSIGKSGRTDFDNTGEFHARMNLNIEGEVYSFDSPAMTDKGTLKSIWLTDWNKAPIMELSPENEALVWDIIKDTFYRKMGELFD